MVVYVDLQAYLSIVGGRTFCRNVERVWYGSLITDSGEKLGGPYREPNYFFLFKDDLSKYSESNFGVALAL